MEKSCTKKEFENFVKSTDNIRRDLEDGRKGRCHGFPAPRHSIFLSVKRYQANCICPLHRGAEPDQTVFGPGYYSSLDIVGSRHHSLVSIWQSATIEYFLNRESTHAITSDAHKREKESVFRAIYTIVIYLVNLIHVDHHLFYIERGFGSLTDVISSRVMTRLEL